MNYKMNFPWFALLFLAFLGISCESIVPLRTSSIGSQVSNEKNDHNNIDPRRDEERSELFPRLELSKQSRTNYPVGKGKSDFHLNQRLYQEDQQDVGEYVYDGDPEISKIFPNTYNEDGKQIPAPWFDKYFAHNRKLRPESSYNNREKLQLIPTVPEHVLRSNRIKILKKDQNFQHDLPIIRKSKSINYDEDRTYYSDNSEYKRNNKIDPKNNNNKSAVEGETVAGNLPIQNVIYKQVYNMMNDAHSLNQLEEEEGKNIAVNSDLKSDDENEEKLPKAQRRYADQQNGLREINAPERINTNKWDLEDVHFTTISVGSLMLFLIMVVMVLALRVHCRDREKSAQEWIRHPIVQPSTAASGSIQPNFRHILHPGQITTEPIRIKAKGLLERRGSNSSLTIDLAGASEVADGGALFSPSRECTPEDFLMTAGSRMNRRQLRQCLRDPRDLHAEFWQIPANHPDKCGVPGAAAKNRYRTVLPNEETRVVLHKAPPDSPETPASQYINANFIRGYDGEERAYIATQGPLANTVEDLWLLVLQERCPALVMITRLKEKGRVKCEPYVPSYSAVYGSVHVTVKQVIQKNGYTIRQIYIKRGDEVHTTLHFWFTSWPDHKAPTSARHLLAMSTEVENARKESHGAVIVHCSAGIGRTGCFIAGSIGKMQLLEEDCVDVLSIVCQMRLDRGGMVQTAEQYEFIHRALALFEATLPFTASSE